MIFFVVKKYHDYTIGNFLQSWGRDLIGKVAILSYEDCAYSTRLHHGTYVFTDFERMSSAQLELARHVAPQIEKAGCRILNRPERVLDRAALQKKLHDEGTNDFRVYRAEEDLAGVKFPVFVRRISDHMGKMSGLIESHDELQKELFLRKARGENDTLVVERIDIRSPDGMFRKYGVLRCGQELVARHLYFSQNWVQNITDIVDDEKVALEAAYMETNPHAEQIRRVFELAGTDYGRVDYGLHNGRVQVWEINTNPMMMAAPYRIEHRRLGHISKSTAKATAAIAALDDGVTFDETDRRNWFGIEVDPHLRSRLGVRPADHALRYVGKALGRISRMPGVKEIINTCQWARWLATR